MHTENRYPCTKKCSFTV